MELDGCEWGADYGGAAADAVALILERQMADRVDRATGCRRKTARFVGSAYVGSGSEHQAENGLTKPPPKDASQIDSA